jgi:NADH:ubiquinone oxidoreductase subunit B-like Fe-S oxidoreductase
MYQSSAPPRHGPRSRIHKLVPRASPAPANKAIVAGDVGAKVLRAGRATAHLNAEPKYAVEHAPGHLRAARHAASSADIRVGEFVRMIRGSGFGA